MTPDDVALLRFTVLGPLGAWRGPAELALGSPQQLAVLAVLLLRRGRPVGTGELVDAVWGEDPPPGAVSVLRTYVSRLRGVLEPGRSRGESPDLLVSVADGYALRVPDDALDLAVFERRVAEARSLEPASAAKELRTALAEWTGVPLAGVPGPFAEAERSRLAELRLGITETRLDLDLELGAHQEVIPELITLTAAHPLRERLSRQLMLALYRSDRQAEALAVYQGTRQTLVRELGVEPGSALRELHASLLAADPEIAAPPPAPRAAPVARPAQLPSSLADFTGRTEEADRLAAALSDPSGTSMPVAVLTGMGGAGKTALAVHTAHRVAEDFPDGQLYIDLRGVDGTPTDPGVVLACFLRGLGQSDQGMPEGLAERAALYRSQLAGRRILVVLDNAHDAEQIRPLLPGANGCATIVTSRSLLAALPATARIPVEVFTPQLAADLFTRIVGAPRGEAERLAVLRVIDLCGGLPLAVRIVASRLAVRPDRPITDVLERLRDERRRLGELSVEDLAVESCFRLGYGQLPADQARAFRLLSVPTPTAIGLPEAAAVLDLSEADAEPLLESLVNVGMLQSPVCGHYRYHDLLRLFARQRAREEESPDACSEALVRLLDHLLATALAAYRLTRPGHTLPATLTAPRRSGVAFADEQEASRWGVRELSGALEVVGQAAEQHPATAADLLLALDPLLMAEHRWSDVVPVGRLVVGAARRAGDERAERRAGYMLGGALMQINDLKAARVTTDRAIELCLGTDDRAVHAMALNVRALLEWTAGRATEAFEQGGRAAAVARAIGDRSVEAMALGNVIQFRLTSEQQDATILDTALRQLALHEELDDRAGQVWALYRLGQVQLVLGRPADALRTHRRAQELLPDGQALMIRAGSLIRAAEALVELGRFEEAARSAESGVMLIREVGHERLEVLGERALGDALSRLGHESWAHACWQKAHELATRLGIPEDVSRLGERLLRNPTRSG